MNTAAEEIEVNTSIGRLGDFVEEMVRPAAVRLFRRRGIEAHREISARPGHRL